MALRPSLAWASCVAAVMLGLAGCSAHGEAATGQGPLAALVADAQGAHLSEDSRTLEFLADGTVTLDEYQQGFADQIACLEDHGIVLHPQYTNKYDSWRLMVDVDYENSAPEGDEPWTLICGANHVKYLELAYSLSATNRVDARLLAHATPCLERSGATLTDATYSVTELMAAVGNQGSVDDCLWESLQAVYPGESAAVG